MNCLTVHILLQIIIITVTTQIFCNEGKSMINFQSNQNSNIFQNNNNKNALMLLPSSTLINENIKNEKHKQYGKIKTDWVPQYILNKANQLSKVKITANHVEGKFIFNYGINNEINCLMDKFKPKQLNWKIFHKTDSELDLSNLKIFDELDILKQLRRFNHLENYNALTLAENNLTSVPYSSLMLLNSTLKYLNLQGNNFFANFNLAYNEEEKLEIAWARFPIMPNLEVLNLANCNIQCLTPEVFKNISHIQTLNLANNNIIKLAANTFSTIPNLVNLDLSSMNSYINDDDDFLSTESYYELLEVGGISIDEFTFKKLKKLEYINFSRTRISPKTKALHHFGKQFKYLGLCLSSIQMLDNKVFNDTNIEVLDLSGNPYFAINLNNNSFNRLENSLKVLWIAESTVKNIFWLKNLKNMQYLNLADNNINSLTNETFSKMKNLKYLDLSANHIGNWYHKIFVNNTLLKVINIQENNINLITPEMYKDFQQMDYLALSKNNFVCYCYLRSLIDHAEKNGRERAKDFIKYFLNENGTNIFDYMMGEVLVEKYYNKFVVSQQNLKNSTKLDHERPDHSEITIYDFQLLDYNEEDYWCYSGSKYLRLNDIDYCKNKLAASEELNETAKFIICAFVVSIIVSLIFIFGYFKKNKIKKIINKIKNYFGLNKERTLSLPINNDPISYKYDVFVSYSDHDREWILEELIPNMDSDKAFKVCLHEREFKVGITIWENIINHMEKSRSILLVISNNFLNSNWCQFEMQFAQKRIFDTKRNQLVLILLEDIPNNMRPKTLQYLMDLRTYIKWPNLSGFLKKDFEAKQIFWTRIKQSLKND